MKYAILVGLFGTLLIAAISSPAAILWTNTTGGNWSNATNWSPNQIPGGGDEADITLSGTYTVTLDASEDIGTLILGGTSGAQTLDTTGNTLTFLGAGGTVNTNGVLDLSGTAPLMVDSGTLTNYGVVNWFSGTIGGHGSTIDNPGLWNAQCDATIMYDITFNGGTFTFNNSGTFLKSAGSATNGTVFSGAYVGVTFKNTGLVDVASGTISLQNGGTLSGNSDGSGTLQLAGGVFALSGGENLQMTGGQLAENSVVNGVVTWMGGNLLPGAGLGTSATTIASNGVVNILAATSEVNLDGGTLTNYGTVNWLGGTIGGGAGGTAINNYGLWNAQCDAAFAYDLTYNGGIFTFNNAGTFLKSVGSSTNSTVFSPAYVGVSFNNTGLVDVESGTVSLQSGGNLSGASSGVGGLLLAGGTFALNGEEDLQLTGGQLAANSVINGILTWTGGFLLPGYGYNNGSGGVTVSTNGVVNIVAGTNSLMLDDGVLTNYGTVNWVSGTTGGHNSTINNNGLWNAQCDATIGYDITFNGGVFIFNNAGTFLKSVGSSTNSTVFSGAYVGATFNNTGVIDVGSGTISLQGGGALGGVSSGPGGLQLGGGTFALGGKENLQMTGGQLAANSVINGVVTWTGGFLLPGYGYNNGRGGVTVSTNGVVNIVAGTGLLMLDDGILTNYGTVNWVSGTIGGHDATINNNGLWNAQCDATIGYDLTYNGGNFTFNNSRTFLKSAGSGTNGTVFSSAYLGVPFNNTGTLSAQTGTVTFNNGASLSGAGTLNFGIAGPSAFGRVSVPGGVTLAGAISVNFNNGFLPASGNSFAVLSYGSATGIFNNLALPSQATWSVDYGAAALTLGVSSFSGKLLGAKVVAGAGGNAMLFAWPTNYGGFSLQYTTNLAPPVVWNTVAVTPAVTGESYAVTNEITGGAWVFRLGP